MRYPGLVPDRPFSAVSAAIEPRLSRPALAPPGLPTFYSWQEAVDGAVCVGTLVTGGSVGDDDKHVEAPGGTSRQRQRPAHHARTFLHADDTEVAAGKER